MSTKSSKIVEDLEKTCNNTDVVETLDQLEALISRVKKAQKEFETFTQEQVDAIFKAAATAADKARIPLARMAVEETGMGVLEDKIIKNHFASEYIYNKHKNTKTCGVVDNDVANGVKIVAEPLGVLAGVIPTTNPTAPHPCYFAASSSAGGWNKHCILSAKPCLFPGSETSFSSWQ